MAIKQQTAELQPLNIQTVEIKIKGLSPLIMHRWSDKAKQAMLDKQMKKTNTKEYDSDNRAMMRLDVDPELISGHLVDRIRYWESMGLL